MQAVFADDGNRRFIRLNAWEFQGERLLTGTVDLLTQFHARHPDIKVYLNHEDWTSAPLHLRYWSGSLRAYAPDMTVIHDEWLAEFKDNLEPLDRHIDPALLENFVPGVLDRGKIDGRLYGIPWHVHSRVLYYRSDIFEQAGLEPPSTLLELQNIAAALSRLPGIYGL